MAETTLGTGSAEVPHEASAAGQNTGVTAGDFPRVSSTASFPQELGSVKLLEVIGRGATGTVYRGYDTMLNRCVAVKFLAAGFSEDAAHRQRFLDEARMVAAIRHPNLVEIYQAGFSGGTYEELAEKHRREPLPAEPLLARGLSASVIEVLQRAAHKELPFPFKSADDFARTLKNAAGISSNPVKARSELSLLVRQAAGLAPAQAKSSKKADAPGAESVDQIIKMTRERRQESIARKYPPLNPSASDGTPDAAHEPHIVADLPCLTCEYNLRGLPLRGLCPECGSPVAQSANPDLLRFAGPAFVVKLRRGAGLILYGVLLSWIVLQVSFELARHGLANFVLFRLLVDLVMLLGAALFLAGIYTLTAVDPRAMGVDKLRIVRTWTRWAATLAVGTFFIASAGAMLARHAAWLAPAIQVTSGFGVAALLLALFGHLRCLRQQTMRIPSLFLCRRARALSWALPLS